MFKASPPGLPDLSVRDRLSPLREKVPYCNKQNKLVTAGSCKAMYKSICEWETVRTR